MEVVVVYTSNVGIRNNNKWEIAESLNAVGEANGQEREGKIGGGEEGFGGERRAAMATDSLTYLIFWRRKMMTVPYKV